MVETSWVDMTALGSATVITVITGTIVGYLALTGRKRSALAVIVALLGAAILLKQPI